MRKLSRAEQIPHVLKQYISSTKNMCRPEIGAWHEKHCWILAKNEIFTQKGLYLLSHKKSVGAVDIFRYSLLRALKWALNGWKRTSGSKVIAIQQCLCSLPVIWFLTNYLLVVPPSPVVLLSLSSSSEREY